MAFAKDTQQGIGERLRTLEPYDPGIPRLLREVLSSKRRNVAADDVLDACAAFITAEAAHGELARLTGEPSRDQNGLPMEVVYLKTSAASEAIGSQIGSQRGRVGPPATRKVQGM